MTRFITVLLLLALAAPAAASDWRLCSQKSREIEAERSLPAHLLDAIASVESGRWSAEEEARLAWPWTVNAEGKGHYLPSREAAIAKVEALQARGIRSIDVGCMQINLRYHPKAFDSLAEAFDPARNVAYAGRFLADLRARHGSWTAAIGRYHSGKPRFSGPYRVKVFRAWREIKHRYNRARIAAARL